MRKTVVALLSILSFLLFACAPRATPSPAPAPAPPSALPAAPTPAGPPISPEDADWQKVVEAAKKEGKATFYAFYYTGDTGIAIRNAFKARYNVDLDIITGRGAEFTERLKTERRMGGMVADVTQSATAHMLNARNLGLLELPKGLPSMRNKADFRVAAVLDKEGYVLIQGVLTEGPMVNTKLVRPDEEPRSWQDMLAPKWKGKMMIHSPLISTGAYITLIPLLNAKAITLELIRDLGKQDLILTRGDQDMADKLSRGEYPMAMALSDVNASTYAKEGAPIKAVPMAEGISVTAPVIAQIKDSPHPNAARLFLDWIMSPEGQIVFHKSQGSLSVRKDVPDFRPQALRLPPDAKLVLETEDDAIEETQKYVDKWLIELWKK